MKTSVERLILEVTHLRKLSRQAVVAPVSSLCMGTSSLQHSHSQSPRFIWSSDLRIKPGAPGDKIVDLTSFLLFSRVPSRVVPSSDKMQLEI